MNKNERDLARVVGHPLVEHGDLPRRAVQRLPSLFAESPWCAVAEIEGFLNDCHYLGATTRGFAYVDPAGAMVFAKPTSRRLPQDGTWLELVRMRGDFDEDEDPDFEPEWEARDDDDMCADCGRIINGEDLCCVCGAAMCYACFEMGAGVCKGPHKASRRPAEEETAEDELCLDDDGAESTSCLSCCVTPCLCRTDEI